MRRALALLLAAPASAQSSPGPQARSAAPEPEAATAAPAAPAPIRFVSPDGPPFTIEWKRLHAAQRTASWSDLAPPPWGAARAALAPPPAPATGLCGTPCELRFEPGEYRVSASAEGMETVHTRLIVTGRPSVIEVRSVSTARMWGGVALLALGGAAAYVGFIMLIGSTGGGHGCEPEDCPEPQVSENAAKAVTFGGLAAVAVGGILVLTAPRPEFRRRADAP